jgi:hypothetical protein
VSHNDEDKASYATKLKECVYYQLLVMKCRGNEKAIQEWMDEDYEDWSENCESDREHYHSIGDLEKVIPVIKQMF